LAFVQAGSYVRLMDKEDREANVKPMGVLPKSEPSSVMYAKANELL